MRTTRGTNPEREAVKEYLQQYHDAKAKKQILEERHRTLSADLRDPGIGSAYRTMPTSKRQAREGGAVSPAAAMLLEALPGFFQANDTSR